MENTTLEVNTHSVPGLMTQAMYINMLEFIYITSLIMAFMGVISNIININVFFVMGINDGVTVCFLALALFDLTFLIASLSLSVSLIFNVSELKFTTKFLIDPYAIFVFSANVMNIISITNILTTTFLAVVRCLCVAKPLQFKNIITKKRAILFMVGVAMFSFVIYMPLLPNMGMINKFDKSSNISRPTLWMSPSREIFKVGVWMVTDMFLPVVTQFLVLICVVVMSRCLRAASRFRQSSGAANALGEKGNMKPDFNQSIKIAINDSNSSTDRLTGKDLRVVQQVVLISVVYIVCNVPKIIISFCTMIEPEFTLGKRYANVYVSVNCVRKQLEIVNAAVNLIIYIKYNNRFRSVLCK